MISITKKLKTFAVAFLVVLALPIVSVAQPPDPGDSNPDPDTPIDGGVSLILAAGAAAGARKLYKDRKAKKQDTQVL